MGELCTLVWSFYPTVNGVSTRTVDLRLAVQRRSCAVGVGREYAGTVSLVSLYECMVHVCLRPATRTVSADVRILQGAGAAWSPCHDVHERLLPLHAQ